MDIHALGVGDLDAVHDLTVRAFGPMDRANWVAYFRPSVERGRALGIYDGDRIVASGRYHLFEQWWHGMPVPMGGVASVVVAPEDRGRGVGHRLAAALLDLMDGLPLSALYPATAPVYHSVGYEHGGAQHWITMPSEVLRTLATTPVRIRRAGPDDAADVTLLLRRLYAQARDCGPIDRGEDFLRGLLGEEKIFSYLADDGFLAYGWGEDQELVVHRCVAGSAATTRALWAMVGSGSSVARTVRACVAPDDPLLWLLRDRSSEELRRVSWMLRVLDAPAAIAGRGFPAGLSARIPLLIEDERCPRNQGAWLLTVGDGAGRLARTTRTSGAVRLTARGLAALYAGVSLARLRRAGLAEGGGPADPLLDAAFSATPFMLDRF